MKNDTKLERAKIFLPFDALKGLKEALREKEKILVDKKILSIEEKEKISKKLIQIKKGMIIKVIYFENNEYIELEGMVSLIDFVYKKIKIDTDDQIEYLKILNSLNEVKDVNAGFEFGATLQGFTAIEVGDIIETYALERI